ncbi:MAG: hypothetical protein ACFFCT_09095 [Candidatus Odinarchaeota archaeon]
MASSSTKPVHGYRTEMELSLKMSFEIITRGSCVAGTGKWSYTINYSMKSGSELIYSDSGEALGTTDIQMKLMAILKALTYVRSMDPIESITIRSDCPFCIKCITKEFDCVNDDAYKRDKVTRGFVQYLQEIWWKIGDLDIQFKVSK